MIRAMSFGACAFVCLALLAGAAAPLAFAAPASSGVAAPATAPATVRVPPFVRQVLPNGLTLVVMRRPEVPLAAFTVVLRGGALGESPDKAGLASLAAGLLEKGAGSRDAFQFADAVANVGGSFGAGAGTETVRVSGQFLARDRQLMIDLLADALLRPRLDAREFETLRSRQIEFIKAAKDSDPSSLLSSYGRAFLFGDHPYARPVGGSERSLAAISHRDVVDYVRANFGADRATLVFVGDVDPVWIRAAVLRAFGKWARAAGKPAVPAVPTRLAGRRVLLVDSPGSSQTYFWLANVGVSRRFPERAALDVVNTLYGGRFTSILNTELRIKSGLSYGASSGFNRGTVPGEFAIQSFTVTENTGKAIDLAMATLERLNRDGVDAPMLDSARAYVLGQYPTGLETAVNWANALADLEFFGLDRSYIESYGPALAAVDVVAARAVIDAAFPKPADLAIVMIGDAAQIRETARAYGTVQELPLAAEEFAASGR